MSKDEIVVDQRELYEADLHVNKNMLLNVRENLTRGQDVQVNPND